MPRSAVSNVDVLVSFHPHSISVIEVSESLNSHFTYEKLSLRV